MRFIRNSRGNVAIMTAMVFLPIMMLVGGAIDLLRASGALAEMRQAADSAVLGMANLDMESTGTDKFEEHARQIFNANAPHNAAWRESVRTEFSREVALNSRTVGVKVTGSIDTMFMGIIGVSSIPINYETKAHQKKQSVEIAMVLDISSSMNGNRLTTLKSSANTFVDTVFQDSEPGTVSVSLIPFGGTVNVGSLFDTYIADTADAGVILDPTEAQYSDLEDKTDQLFRFSDGFNCFETFTSDFVTPDDVPATGSRSQVPTFWKWNDFNSWCPASSSEVFLNTENVAQLKLAIDAMTLSDGTGTDVGVLWGYRALSPKWRGLLGGDYPDRPIDFNDEHNLKVMVVMTDGGITAQLRPEDASIGNTHTNRTNLHPADRVVGDRAQGRHGNRGNEQRLYRNRNNPSFDPASPQDYASDHFLRVCHFAAENNIVVYTISFNLSAGSSANQLLARCASDPSKHYLVDGIDLQDAFESIAGSISSLRLVE